MTLDRCCRVCCRGFVSCSWKTQRPSNKKWCWCSVVTLAALISLCWGYVCLVFYNERDGFNWTVFRKVHKHMNYYMVVMTISAVVATYCALLLIFALVQIALGDNLYLHWLHRILIFLGVIFIALGIAGLISTNQWQIIPFSLQYMAPFLQFGAVGALTLLSWFFFQAFHEAKNRSRILIAVVFLAVSGFILLCPLLIRSPCLIDIKEINLTKPYLWGHRGAPMLAPENTLMSFERSANECNVMLFETDVQLSKDRIPYLMHDSTGRFLERTTNCAEKNVSCNSERTFDELKTLNAGEWFIKTDPFQTVHLLTEEQRARAETETIPSLSQFLELAKQKNTMVMFDLYIITNYTTNDTVDTVKTILDSGINPERIYWLPPKHREYVKKNASKFIQVYNNETEMIEQNGSHVNVKYTDLSMDKIRELRRKNISVNLFVVNERWLFSLLWCAEVSSVTTNNCHVLSKMEQPDWTMAPGIYRITWISVDAASILTMIGFFVYHWKKSRSNDKGEALLSRMSMNNFSKPKNTWHGISWAA